MGCLRRPEIKPHGVLVCGESGHHINASVLLNMPIRICCSMINFSETQVKDMNFCLVRVYNGSAKEEWTAYPPDSLYSLSCTKQNFLFFEIHFMLQWFNAS